MSAAGKDNVGMALAVQNLEALIQETVQAKQTELIELRSLKPLDTGKLRDEDEGRLRTTAFTFLVTKHILGLDDSDALEAIVDGGKDLGIDAIHWTEPKDSVLPITLVQTKLYKRLDGKSSFSETVIDSMIRSIIIILNRSAKYTANARLSEKIERIRSHQKGARPQVRVVLASNGTCWAQAGDDKIANAEFGEDVTFEHIGPMEIHRSLNPKRAVDGEIMLAGRYIHETFGQREALVGRARLKEVAMMLHVCGDDILDKNVRHFLGAQEGGVNSNIAETIKSSEVENFYFYNNGLTIICDKFDFSRPVKEDILVKLTNMQIINGGQTCRVVKDVLSETGTDPDAYVLIRVHQVGKNDDQLVRSITYATNRQSSVNLADLQANDIRQEYLQTSINNLGYRYRRKRNQAPLVEKEYTATEVARAVLDVWRGMPALEKAETDLFGPLYLRIFSDDLNGAQAVLAVHIMRKIKKLRDNPEFFPDHEIYKPIGVETQDRIRRFLDGAGARLGKSILDAVCASELENLDDRRFQNASDYLAREGDALIKADYESFKAKGNRPQYPKPENLLDIKPNQLNRHLGLEKAGSIIQSFSHGGSKTVAVEVKRKRKRATTKPVDGTESGQS
jgi:hypothetical protein